MEFFDFPEENWKPVAGFEGLYEVSNYGRVKSVERVIAVKGHKSQSAKIVKERLLRQKVNRPYRGGSYKRMLVALWKDNKEYTRNVARLVAEAFIPNPDSLECVLHLDDDATNNHATNLSWGTREENVVQAVERKRVKFGDNHHASRLSMKQRNEIAGLVREQVAVSQIAKYYGVTTNTIYDIKNGRVKLA